YQVSAAFTSSDSNYDNGTPATNTITITPRPTRTTVTVTPSTQSYGDKVTFAAIVAATGGVPATGAATTVTFMIGSQTMAGPLPLTLAGDGTLRAMATDVPLIETVAGQLAPGTRTVTAVLGAPFSSNFYVSHATTNLTITPRVSSPSDAGVYYTGAQVYWTTGPSTSTATLF